ncbi:hypothetical protein KFK09_012825 [Dendrobium nobile]|uniref:Uncharacterized protein n=1 Tax=Dendrobium nobile TaxID=94219 RepID=A0A8T3BIX8_DENNO|nr:hypothetical protein KFK09_012825 [Dendrobium nobile]
MLTSRMFHAPNSDVDCICTVVPLEAPIFSGLKFAMKVKLTKLIKSNWIRWNWVNAELKKS